MGSRRVNRPWAVGLLALMAAIALLVAFVGGGGSGSSNGSGDNDSAAPLSSGGHTVTGAV
jgi:hypothetical protein